MDYSPWIQLQTIIVDINEAKALAMKNQPGKSTDNKNVSGVSPQSTYVSPQINALQGFPTEMLKNP